MPRWAGGLLAGVALLSAVPDPGAAQAVLTQAQALRLAFPEPATIERRTAFISDAAARAARAAAGPGVEIAPQAVTYYAATRGGRPVGVAYFDVHRVRTLAEVLMIVVSPEGRIQRVEVLKFQEPPEYRAPDGWLEQIEGRGLDKGLSLKGGVVNMTGATLTSQAVVRASRRVLALHRMIRPFGAATVKVANDAP